MKFLDQDHRNLIDDLMKLWAGIKGLSELGQKYGIDDIFQDNGAKILQQLILMNFQNLGSREGNDAKDINGTEWELKSANESKVSGVSTHHHLNHVILKKYRSVPWMISIYNHIELKEIYLMSPAQLEPVFKGWEDHLNGKKIFRGKRVPKKDSLNNPKIPIYFIREHGTLVYPFPKEPLCPATWAKKSIKKSK